MLQCHDASKPHKDPKAQRYHEMALATYDKGKGNARMNYVDEESTSSRIFTAEQKQRFDRNIKSIKNNLKQIVNNPRLRNLLVPISAGLYTENKIVSQYNAYKARAKSEEETRLVENYGKATKEIMALLDENVPDKNIESFNADDINKLWDTIDKKRKELAEIVKKKGKKCPEYGQYRAYYDFQSKMKSIQSEIENRLVRQESESKQRAEAKRRAEELRSRFKS